MSGEGLAGDFTAALYADMQEHPISYTGKSIQLAGGGMALAGGPPAYLPGAIVAGAGGLIERIGEATGL